MTRFQFLHIPRRRHPVVVAYFLSQDEGHDYVTYAASFCSPADQFNRVVGRQMAEGRLEKYGKSFEVIPRQTETFHQAVSRMIREVVRSGHAVAQSYPKRHRNDHGDHRGEPEVTSSPE